MLKRTTTRETNDKRDINEKHNDENDTDNKEDNENIYFNICLRQIEYLLNQLKCW